jgi:hypothetical protein
VVFDQRSIEMNASGNIECLSSAVAEGVAKLDLHNEGWWANIDLDTLDLRSSTNCILGQLYGNFGDGRDALEIQFGCGDLYGFDSYQDNWERLNFLWSELISERRAANA